MSDAITGAIRFVHILTGATWVGAVFLWSMVIAPRVLKNGPPAIRRPFIEAVIEPMTRFMQIAAVLALLSGFVLVGQLWGWADYFNAFEVSRYGPWLSFGVLAAIGMAIVGFGVNAPTGKKMLNKMRSLTGPPGPEDQAELAAMGKKLGIGGMVTVLFGTLTLVGMALAVNVLR